MAPDIPKIDPDRHPNLGDAAWNFRDEVFQWLFHGNSLSDPRELLIPFLGNLKLFGVSGPTSCRKPEFSGAEVVARETIVYQFLDQSVGVSRNSKAAFEKSTGLRPIKGWR